jgi:hypothetical protein
VLPADAKQQDAPATTAPPVDASGPHTESIAGLTLALDATSSKLASGDQARTELRMNDGS